MTLAQPPKLVGDLPLDRLTDQLHGDGLGVRLGCFTAKIRAEVSGLAAQLHSLYRDYPLLPEHAVHTLHVRLTEVVRPWRKRRVRFTVDGHAPHEDLPADQALAVLEWGINLVLALRMQSFLMLHSAALERNGRLLLLPAAPGHGKTTLCAALAHRGWRLFSDEFGMTRPGSLEFVPLPRLMPLKNASIAVIRAFAPEAELGPTIYGTRKGDVAHVKPPADSIRRAAETARPAWIVFPRWRENHELVLEPLTKGDAFMLLATNAFNYEAAGEPGFITLRDAIDTCRCLRLTYSSLEQATAALTAMADEVHGDQ